MSFRFIDKIGIELEAAWSAPRKDLVPDASFSIGDFPIGNYGSVGELVSQPFSSRQELIDFVTVNWPVETCEKCAIHLHFSLKDIGYYSSCMSFSFYDYFIQQMVKWGKSYPCKNEWFWKRLGGKNRYCARKFRPDIQASYLEKGHNRLDRRDHWNFCYGLHKTFECRLLPMFKNLETAISAIDALIACIESYLSIYHKPYLSTERLILLPELTPLFLDKKFIINDGAITVSTVSEMFADETLPYKPMGSWRKLNKSDVNSKQTNNTKFNYFEYWEATKELHQDNDGTLIDSQDTDNLNFNCPTTVLPINEEYYIDTIEFSDNDKIILEKRKYLHDHIYTYINNY